MNGPSNAAGGPSRRTLPSLPRAAAAPASGGPGAGVARLIRAKREQEAPPASPGTPTGPPSVPSTTAPAEEGNGEAVPPQQEQTDGVPDSVSTGPEAVGQARPGGTPKWRQLTRREARLHREQVDRMSELTRSLNRARQGEGERITDNTLLRIAADLLLRDAGRLHGSSEDELRASVGLGPLRL